ncbi:C2 calcium/lipid-binding plant phosphoribosyltransferase familyprotein [Zostera marina]|uniref:C2 calcium/lipid-binding plant phosphoribosyltransferase familyprotein n=1 Tax=Zostera marina TaxID=29655 RepID=A0A0K9PLM0_ZOSMR|nr:C2 calcium/lipid-binding plant phosphoribosyltransferase familyprotein [Zostera marina]
MTFIYSKFDKMTTTRRSGKVESTKREKGEGKRKRVRTVTYPGFPDRGSVEEIITRNSIRQGTGTMMANNNLKLGVEVISASNLMAKDGQGSSTSYVEINFDSQRFRTTVKDKDLNPVWNERFYFNITDSDLLPELALEAYVYNISKATDTKSFLGKVRIAGTSFVNFSDAVVMYYPLEKRGIFSRVKGDLGLKVFVTDDPAIKLSNPLPAIDPFAHTTNRPSSPAVVPLAAEQDHNDNKNEYKKKDDSDRHIFRSIPKHTYETQQIQNQHQQQQQPTQSFMAPVPPPQLQQQQQHPMMQRMYSASSPQQPQPVDYAIKETSPFLGGGRVVGGRVIRGEKPFSTYDLVESMQYLFVRVQKAKDLPTMDITGSLDPYVEVRLGNYKGTTRTFEKNKNPEWNEVFAFSRENLQANILDVLVKDKDLVKDDFVGIVRFDLHDVPHRIPPDSPLAPEWYRLGDKKGERVKGELMLAVWTGTQADECFSEAWHSDAATTSVSSWQIRSKVYHAPRLWYVRCNVIEAQDLVPADRSRVPDVYVKAQIGHQVHRTKPIQSRGMTTLWNEDLMFVAAEPFEDHLVLTVEDRVGGDKDEVIGRIHIPLHGIDKRLDDRMIQTRWYNLEKPGVVDLDQLKKDKFSSRIHLRLCLEGGYHVLDESTHYSSDFRPTARQLWKPSVGLLELGILGATGLHPMKPNGEGKGGTSDTYCVAKYSQKWVRTRTIINSLMPKYNEQYTWEVFDPATVLTVGVFDNHQIGGEKGEESKKDLRIGKVRIRLSTLQTGRVYTNSYPLLVLQQSGVKKMGEIHLAIRFSSTSLANMMYIYSRPLLPKMHYVRPLSVMQVDHLKQQAVTIVAARLSRMEPPLRREVVEYMSDFDAHLWSMRKSKANFFRLVGVFGNLVSVVKWFGGVCVWTNPITTVLVHILFVILACFPELILPTAFLYIFLIGIWNYRYRPRSPPHMNTRISHAENLHPDELDEEFDTFPTSRPPELVRMRYDRLRSVAGRMQTVIGDVATQGERIQGLISWRDPRSTGIFMLFCLIAAVVLYVTPMQVVIVVAGFYCMRHPRFRSRMPSVPLNFFRRLPAKTDSML